MPWPTYLEEKEDTGPTPPRPTRNPTDWIRLGRSTRTCVGMASLLAVACALRRLRRLL